MAAIQDADGTVFSVPRPGRHPDVIKLMVSLGKPTPVKGQQGFVTNQGRFVDRIEGKTIAKEANQLIERASKLPKLFSEDLW